MYYDVIDQFAESISKYTGAPYVVPVDTCTDAIFLCCKYYRVKDVFIPGKTYVSVPNAIQLAGGRPTLTSDEWKGIYRLLPYPIFDSAMRFTSGMYIPGSLMCISFQYKKHLPIGRGGAILTDSYTTYEWLRVASFNGKVRETGQIVMKGYHMFMEPERAARGLTLMQFIKNHNKDLEHEYEDLRECGLWHRLQN